MKKFEERDFSKYEGKEIDWNGEQIGVVDHIDYDIGITISDKYNKEDRLECLTNANVVNAPQVSEQEKKVYKSLFCVLLAEIKRGKIDHARTMRRFRRIGLCFFGKPLVVGRHSNSISAERCAFSQ